MNCKHLLTLLGLCGALSRAHAQVPQLIHYQGRIALNGTNFAGTGQFKFALVGTNQTGASVTLWSNDGTSAAGNAPAASVSLSVDNGLYSVLLGDATLPNMRVISAATFTNADVRLRIWFGAGASGFEQLSPDQRIAAVGYAMMAGTAATVSDGAITSDKLADGAVSGNKLAGGSVTTEKLALGAVSMRNLAIGAVGTAQLASGAVWSDNIAPGAIGAAQLARRYDAGRFNIPGQIASALSLDESGQVQIALPFNLPFSRLPIVTFGLETTNLTESQQIQISLIDKTTTNFTVQVKGIEAYVQTIANIDTQAPLDTRNDYGQFNSLAIVNGRPAISCYDTIAKGLVYVQANDPAGTTWPYPRIIDGGPDVGTYTCLAVIDGKPAIGYRDESRQALKFIRSLDSDGAAWDSPSTLVASGVMPGLSLAVVNGSPAIAFTGADGNMYFLRAANALGTIWGSPVQVGSAIGSPSLMLKMINNTPAIVALVGSTLKFVRANDVNGSAWSAPVVVASNTEQNHLVGQVALEAVHGNPAIAVISNGQFWQAGLYTPFYSSGYFPSSVQYFRALDGNGSTWSEGVNAAPLYADPPAYGDVISLAVVDNCPTLSFIHLHKRVVGSHLNPYTYQTVTDYANDSAIYYVRAQDVNGTVWRDPVVAGGRNVSDASLALVAGAPAFALCDHGTLSFVRASQANGDSWDAPGVIPWSKVELAGLVAEKTTTDGTPLVVFHDPASSDLKAVRAADPWSTRWNASATTIETGGSVGAQASLAIVRDTPVVAYRDESKRRLKVARVNGSRWTTPVAIDEPADNGAYPSLLVGKDHLAAAYYDTTHGDLRFVLTTSLEGTAWGKWVTLDSAGDVGQHPCLLLVNDNPAICYLGSGLKFIRATDAVGKGWGAPMMLDKEAGMGPATTPTMAIVNGSPAIAYYVTGSGLTYVRANDASGSSWGPRAKVDTATGTGYFASLAMINNHPAIAYYDATLRGLKYVRAVDVNGTDWRSPRIIDDKEVGQYACLRYVGGRPAISYWAAGARRNLRFVQADDSDGAKWGTPVDVDAEGDVGEWTSMASLGSRAVIAYYDSSNTALKCARQGWTLETVDGGSSGGSFISIELVNTMPAVSYYDAAAGNLKYVRAKNTSGTLWDAPLLVDTNGDVGLYTSLKIVGGKPAIAHYDVANGDLKYVGALDANGTAWSAPLRLDTNGDVGRFGSLAVVNNNPAVAYYDASNGDLKYIRSQSGGLLWGVPVVVDAGDAGQDVGQFASLAVVNGRPAIAYYDATRQELRFIRANDIDGVDWGSVQVVDVVKTEQSGGWFGQGTTTGGGGKFATLLVIGGKPVIAYYQESYGDLRLVRANDAEGTAWSQPVTVDTGGGNDVGRFAVLAEASGNPSITYWDYSAGKLKNYYPVKPFQINWFAVEP